MLTADRLERSRSTEAIDYSSIGCVEGDDPLVPVVPSERIVVEPVWLSPDDVEGRLYADYIRRHPAYDRVWVRRTVSDRLVAAADSLPTRVQLVVRAGHRPLDVQKRLLHEVMSDYASNHPEVSDEQALAHARTYVSDPAIKLPPHCCGSAVDVELRDVAAGELLDFGSTLNDDAAISHLHHPDLTPGQRANRTLLLTAMLDAGFASYHAEWWHYSYGDQLWAWFYGHPSCLHGLVEPDGPIAT